MPIRHRLDKVTLRPSLPPGPGRQTVEQLRKELNEWMRDAQAHIAKINDAIKELQDGQE